MSTLRYRARLPHPLQSVSLKAARRTPTDHRAARTSAHGFFVLTPACTTGAGDGVRLGRKPIARIAYSTRLCDLECMCMRIDAHQQSNAARTYTYLSFRLFSYSAIDMRHLEHCVGDAVGVSLILLLQCCIHQSYQNIELRRLKNVL